MEHEKHWKKLLPKLDVQKIYTDELRGVLTGNIGPNGYQPTQNPFKQDKRPSAGLCVNPSPEYWYMRGGIKIFNANGDEKDSMAFIGLVYNLHPQLAGESNWNILQHYAETVGLKIGKNSLGKFVCDYVYTDEFGTPVHKTNRYEPKDFRQQSFVNGKWIWSTKGCDLYLYNLPEVIVANDVIIAEGEKDCDNLIANGFVATTNSGGAKKWREEYTAYLSGKMVSIIPDHDEQGESHVTKVTDSLSKDPTIKIMVIDIPGLTKKQDVSDWFEAGHTKEELLELIDKTLLFEKKPEKPEPLVLKSFEDIDNSEYAGKYVTVPLYIFGENSQTYHALTRVLVGDCPMKKKIGCSGRDDWQWTCDEPIPMTSKDRIQLSCINASETQLIGALRQHVCDRNQKPYLHINDEDKVTIREVFAHQVSTEAASVNTMVERAVYVRVPGGKALPIGQYQATGYIRTNPKNQQPTMLIDEIEHLEADWQAFNLEESKPMLRKLQAASVDELIEDISSVTKIYDRNNLHLTVMLTLCSPRRINLPGDGLIRGWISSIIVGDSGTGKTFVSEGILNHVGVGDRVSGMTASRTGITYGIDYDKCNGWKLKAGIFLKMSGQALLIDEAQDIDESDMKTMSDGIDTGRVKIDRIQSREFEAETRCIFSCNPKTANRKAQQRVMGSFRWGVQAIQALFPIMMIRRADLFQFVTSSDIKDKNTFHVRRESTGPKWATAENLRALVYYAWNLKDEDTNISKEMSDLIRSYSFKLSNKFGLCADLLIVCPEDFRKTFARTCSSFAVLDLSTDDDFETITIKKNHVERAAQFIDESYSHESCRLDAYSEMYKSLNEIEDEEALCSDLSDMMAVSYKDEYRLVTIIKQLSAIDPTQNDTIPQRFFAELFDVVNKTVQREMKWFLKQGLVTSYRGYKPTIKLVRLMSYIDKHHPEILEPNENNPLWS